MTWDKRRMSKRSLGEDPVMIECQRIEVLNFRPMSAWNTHLQVVLTGQKSMLLDTTQLPVALG